MQRLVKKFTALYQNVLTLLNSKFWKLFLKLLKRSIGFILLIVILRTLLIHEPKQENVVLDEEFFKYFDFNSSIKRFQSSLTFATITSHNEQDFVNLLGFLKKSFPHIFSSKFVDFNFVDKKSLYLHFKGKDSDLKPYLLMGHLDVVPVEYENWNHDPFSGKLNEDGYIYSRGTLDTKGTVMGILESLEILMKQNFQPNRSFYVCFGHDEELRGLAAKKMAKILQQQMVKLEFILDEGLMIFPGSSFLSYADNIALVSVTEKGYLSLNISVFSKPGHASISEKENAPIILSKALSKLNGNCHPNLFGTGPEYDMIQSLAPHSYISIKPFLANLWLFKYLMGWICEWNRFLNALARTTMSVTMIHSGYKENINPSSAWAVLNLRIHSSTNSKEVIEYTKSIIYDDRIKMEVIQVFEAHHVSPYGENDFGFQMIKKSVKDTFDNVVILPAVMVASTDTFRYLSLSEAIYRFSPIKIKFEDAEMIHGNNERISIDAFKKAIIFYYKLVLNCDKNKFIPHSNLHFDL